MQEIVANCDNVKFDIEIALEQQLGAQPLPFPGMDKTTSAVCSFYAKSSCSKGTACPFRHVLGDRTIVCKHWLRGLCKKGDQCEFLHEYDMTKMPECYFYSRFNACHNKECPFLHIDPESKIKDCPWYDRGFCRHGPNCRHRHVRRVICVNYVAGFCPEGPSCKFMHPRFELPAPIEEIQKQVKKVIITCHYCGESGHKVVQCPKMPPELKELQMKSQIERQEQMQLLAQRYGMTALINHLDDLRGKGQQRPLEEVTCYKCGGKGHYANKCPKGHLAFLSSDLTNLRERS